MCFLYHSSTNYLEKVGSYLLLCYNAKRRPKISRNLYTVQFSLLVQGYHEKSIGYR